MASEVPIDESDPLVVLITWCLTYVAGQVPWLSERRFLLPTVAVLIAVGIRAGMQATVGEPISPESLARGFAAGATAVLLDVQRRQITKSVSEH